MLQEWKMTDRVPILHLINGEFYAGGERVQDLLALRLPQFGYDVTFVCFKQGVFNEMRQAKNVTLYDMSMKSKIDFRQAFGLVKIIKQGGYRLVHSHTRRAALIGEVASAISRVPMVHHVHSPSDKDTEEGWRNAVNSAAERISLINAKRLIPVSSSLEGYLLKRGYRQSVIETVWNGVPVQKLLRRTRTASDSFVIGMVALFRPRKGVEILLDAVAKLRSEGHEVSILCVGPFETKSYEIEVKERVTRLNLTDLVQWTGFTDNVTAQFPRMDAFALPSLFGEGMPMVLLEAMSAGLPVISTRVEGIPEVVRDGVDGLLVEPGDSEQLAQALRKFVSGAVDTDSMGDNGRNRQNENFSDLAMARGVSKIYQEILGC
jgi:glycosyltransferase involved in cell wall biosynthesis